jgi:hypothetical protein
MGLLYGEGDPLKTLEISTRCGQDSDCNPSNALAVLGVINGFSGLPADMQEGVKALADSTFIHTTYSFSSAVESTYNYAIGLIEKGGGTISGRKIRINLQQPVEPEPEVAFPDVVFDRRVSVFEENAWKTKGKWNVRETTDRNGNRSKQSMFSENKGDEIEITFTGTGISITGNWFRDGGKADIYVDGALHRTVDTYYYFANQQHVESIWHVMNLAPGEHKVKLVVRGEKRPEAAGARVYITGATIFKTAPKKNEDFKFSFE